MMKSFRQWLEQNAMQSPQVQASGQPQQQAWKMSKAEVLQHWQQLQPGMPMSQLRVIPPDHKGPTYRYDGIRLTGSSQFIDSVMSRIKDLLGYEGSSTRLSLIYRQQVDSKLEEPIPDSFVFYVQAKDREEGKSGPIPGGDKPKEVKPAPSPLTPPTQ